MHLKRLLVATLLFALACKSPTPEEELDSIISWIGTAVMAGDAWIRHTTPDAYTRQTLELSHDTLLQLADDLLKQPLPGVDTASLDSVLTRSRGRVAEMARLVQDKNSPAFNNQLDSLRIDEKAVKHMADALSPKQ